METVDSYILKQPKEVQQILERIREMIKSSAGEVEESISYGMPAYKTFGRPLIYFAAYPNHIGLYATPSGHKQFAKELSQYKQGKGSVQFPLNKEMPFDLIQQLIDFRVEENRKNFGS